MDESTLVVVSFIKDLMIIISLAILIVVLIALAISAINLIGPVKSLKSTTRNLEEASGLVLSSAKDVSRTFGIFGNFNRVLERVRDRFRSGEEA